MTTTKQLADAAADCTGMLELFIDGLACKARTPEDKRDARAAAGKLRTLREAIAASKAPDAGVLGVHRLAARLRESNGVLQAFKHQSQTAAFQLRENQATLDSVVELAQAEQNGGN